MDQAAIGHLRQRIGPKIRTRFPGVPVEQVVVLQYGDDPVVGPGDCHLRVVLSADGGEDEREQVLQDFSRAFRCELRKFWDELASSVPEAACLELRFGTGEGGPASCWTASPGLLRCAGWPEADLTPVMASLAAGGPGDAGHADQPPASRSNRADAVRWALTRIRERPAYEQLRARSREIEELKAQF